MSSWSPSPCRGLAALGTTVLLLAAPLAASAGPGPYNTGLDAAGAVLASNAVDPHYQITRPALFGPTYAKHDADGPPLNAGGWLLDAQGSGSAWLVPSPDFFFGDVPGVTDLITWRTSFDLSGYDFASGHINGRWAADDSGLQIRLNGVSLAGVAVAQHDLWTAFSISGGFVAGVNVLEFDTYSTLNPTGLRVEFESVFAPVPEPGTWALWAGGLLALAWRRGLRVAA